MDVSSPSSSAILLSPSGHTSIIIISAVSIVLCVLCATLRLYTRVFTKTSLGWDDCFIFLAVLLQLVTAALLLWVLGIDHAGQPLIPDDDAEAASAVPNRLFLEISFLCTVLYFSIAVATRLSVLFLYNRIFAVATFRPGFIAICTLVIGSWAAATVATLTSCIPLSTIWIGRQSDSLYCINFNHFWTATGVAEVLLDILILMLPVLAVLKLQLNMRKKLAYLGIFIPGTFVIVTGIIRISVSFAPGSRLPNFTPSAIWTTVHTGIAIIGACLPIFKPLFVQISRLHLVRSASRASSRAAMLPTAQRWSPLEPLPGLPNPFDSAPTADDRGRWMRVSHSPSNSAGSISSLIAVATPMSERSRSRSSSAVEMREGGVAVAETAAEGSRDERFWTATATTIGLGIGTGGPVVQLRDAPGLEARYSVVSHVPSDGGTFLSATVSALSEMGFEEEAGNEGASDYGRLLSPPLERVLKKRPSDWELDPAVYTVLQLKRAGSSLNDPSTELGNMERGN